MLINLLKKYWKNIFDALLIVGLIVAVFLINPWHIFGRGLKTHQTANNVSSIKKIGQLITAEYYGEAIATIDQSRLQMIYSDSITDKADSVFRKMKKDLFESYRVSLENTPEKKNLFGRISEKLAALFTRTESEKLIKDIARTTAGGTNDDLSKIVLEYLRATETSSALEPEKNIDKEEIQETLTQLLNDIVDKANKLTASGFDNYLQGGLPGYNNLVFSDYYYNKKRENFTRKENRKELSMIGRGWVKAGFDFGQLDESNFYFDREQGVVHLFGVHAEILNADINPWFIPRKRIPGFQILEANRKVDFRDAVKVKKYCIEKLRKMALDAGILQQAEIQGKETLKNFLGLVTGIEIREVYFHYDQLSVISREVLNDHFISYEEARMLDTLINRQIDTILSLDAEKTNYTGNQKLKEIKIQQLKSVLANLHKALFEEKGRHYDRLSTVTFKIAADSILTPDELQLIRKYRWNVNNVLNDANNDRLQIENTVWYPDKLAFINAYNDAIDEIKRKTKWYGALHERKVESEADYQKLIDSLKVDTILNKKVYDSEIIFSHIDSLYSDTLLSALKYPLNIADNWQEMIGQKGNIKSVDRTGKTNSKDVLKISPEVYNEFSDTIPVAKFGNISVTADENGNWKLDSVHLLTPEGKRVLEYYINTVKQERSAGFFTRANERMREAFDGDNYLINMN